MKRGGNGKKPVKAKAASRKAAVAVDGPDARLVALVGTPSSGRANPVQTRALVSTARAKVRKFEETESELVQELGTLLVTLFRAGAHRLFGCESFVEFADAEFGIKRTMLYRYVAVAKYATPRQAAWGVMAVIAAGRLVELLRGDGALRRRVKMANDEPRTISDLEKVAFTMTSGATLRLDAHLVTGRDVDDVVEHLTAGATPTENLPLALRRQNDALRTSCATEEALEGVSARWAKKRGRPTLKVEIPRGADVNAVFAALREVLTR